ncbi:hypothetical protein RISK_000571 [Rhodopirellula islandica]|uniref:Uncharacterized protein n=1 Tax=Rhodopirellula islandica TaxID=595434 RepID=A0A0J1BM11_RHOIS|nr:hypothetical protein RISK_000571 [Rhodopirellula islandica]
MVKLFLIEIRFSMCKQKLLVHALVINMEMQQVPIDFNRG